MPLVNCPDCEKEISDAAPGCIHCGRPMAIAREVVSEPMRSPLGARPQGLTGQHGYGFDAPETANLSTRRTAFCCSRCGSTEVQRFDVVWRGGTSSIDANTTGVGLAGGGVGIGAARTKGTQRTALAQDAAPPEQRNLVPGVLFAVFGAILLLVGFSAGGFVVLTGLIVVTGGAFQAYDHHRYNTEVYPQLHERWKRSFLCMRCGQRLVANQL